MSVGVRFNIINNLIIVLYTFFEAISRDRN